MTKRGIFILFIVVAVASGLLGWLSAELLAAKIKRDRLADRLGEIQLAVEAYAVDHQGNYPASLDELLAAGTLSAMPENPYTHEPMPVLDPADDPVPGGVVYVAWGAQVIATLKTDDSGEQAVVQPRYVPTLSLDSYSLVVYGDGVIGKHEFPQVDGPAKEKMQSIAWPKVAFFFGTPTAICEY